LTGEQQLIAYVPAATPTVRRRYYDCWTRQICRFVHGAAAQSDAPERRQGRALARTDRHIRARGDQGKDRRSWREVTSFNVRCYVRPFDKLASTRPGSQSRLRDYADTESEHQIARRPAIGDMPLSDPGEVIWGVIGHVRRW
jgi:hypothetical protein